MKPPAKNEASRKEKLLEHAMSGNAVEIARLISEGGMPRLACYASLRLAACGGHAECVRLLIPVSEWRSGEPDALQAAAEHGHEECVRLLIPVSKPKIHDSHALQMAAEGGHAECVKLLIPASDINADGSRALERAARWGHPECVRLLLHFLKPRENVSLALRWAAINGHHACVDLLIQGQGFVSLGDRLQALSAAARYDREECFKLLLCVCGALNEDGDVFATIVNSGRAKIFAATLAHQPSLLGVINLPLIQQRAKRRGYDELASLALALIEQGELAVGTPNVEKKQQHPRL